MPVTADHVDHGLRAESAAEADRAARSRLDSASPFVLQRRRRRPRPEPRGAGPRRPCWPPSRRPAPPGTRRRPGRDGAAQLLRGAGLDGLAGMTPAGGNHLLRLRRAETARAVRRRSDIAVVRDPSNLDRRFRRNRVRHELLPLHRRRRRARLVPMLTRRPISCATTTDCSSDLAAAIDPTDAGPRPPPTRPRPPRRPGLADRRRLSPGRRQRGPRARRGRAASTIACELAGGVACNAAGSDFDRSRRRPLESARGMSSTPASDSDGR